MNFTVRSPSGRHYTVKGDPWTTIDTVWMSEKCWCTANEVVTITDENGNSKTFSRAKGEIKDA